MKNLVVLLTLAFAGNAFADLSSLSGNYSCINLSDKDVSSLSIDAKNMTMNFFLGGTPAKASIVDITENLSAQDQQLGYKLLSVVDNGEVRTTLKIKKTDGKLSLSETDDSGRDANGSTSADANAICTDAK